MGWTGYEAPIRSLAELLGQENGPVCPAFKVLKLELQRRQLRRCRHVDAQTQHSLPQPTVYHKLPHACPVHLTANGMGSPQRAFSPVLSQSVHIRPGVVDRQAQAVGGVCHTLGGCGERDLQALLPVLHVCDEHTMMIIMVFCFMMTTGSS